MDFTDVLEQLECSDSECDEISSGEEFEDLEDIVDVDIEKNTSDVAEDSDSSDDNVPLADLPCSKEVAGKYKFEKRRRTFVPPTLPLFIPEKELLSPEERIPIEYIRMFLLMICLKIWCLNQTNMELKRMAIVQTLQKKN